jgi:predicted DsbA family dithiol-disulfide isomerase
VLAEWIRERFGAAIEWLPFDLHPEYPPEGVPRNPERSERTRGLFVAQGLVYNPPDIAPRSLDALRLTEHARAQGIHAAFHDRLMDAYWAEAQDLGSHEVLGSLASEVGLEGASDVLASDAYADDVRGSTAQAHGLGINGIPAFLLDRKLLVLGAHPREVFERAFAQLDASRDGEA